MKITIACLGIVAAVLVQGVATAQGTFVVDQQSTNGVEGTLNLNRTPIGQSFTPSLDSIGFVDLLLRNGIVSNSAIVINIHSDSITGGLLGTSDPTTLPTDTAGTYGIFDFLFSTPIALNPGTKYYFEPVFVSGGPTLAEMTMVQYSGGDVIYDGSAHPSDLWFREGIVTNVPEPSSAVLLVVAIGALFIFRSGTSRS